MAKTRNPSVPDLHFEEFSVPSLDDFVGDDGGAVAMSHPDPSEMLVQVLRACLFAWDDKRRGCPVTPFLSGCDLSSPWLMRPLRRRIVTL